MKSLFRSYFPTLYAFQRVTRALLLDRSSYIHTCGYFRSAATWQSSDAQGNAIPWMNYSVVRLLGERLKSDMSVFEFGSGNSTQFLAQRVGSVVACEHDASWYEQVKASAPDNVKLMVRKNDIDGQYCRAICAESDTFDIIIVDGMDRVNCVRQAIEKLSSSGVVVLDDSEREEQHAAFDLMEQHGFRCLTIEGLKSLQRQASCTSIFYRNENCLGL